MLLPRIFAPARAAISTARCACSPSSSTTLDLLRSLNRSSASPILTSVRYATHQSEGRANGAKDGAGKRLGAKKTAEEYVIPGNIIFKQRGTLWFPGENCDIGRDHTIFATQAGYVKFYRDPLKHPKRRYIGVVFNRTDTLPYPPHAARKRRLGMITTPMKDASETAATPSPAQATTVSIPMRGKKAEKSGRVKELTMRPGYAYREANWQIGRAAERAGIKVKEYQPGDRFLAWRKRAARAKKNAERKAIRKGKK